MSLTNYLLSSTVVICCCLFIGNIFFKKKIEYTKPHVIVVIIASIIFLPIIHMSFSNFIKMFMNYLLFGCLYKLVFNQSINKSFMVSLVCVIYYFIAEMIFSIPMALFIKMVPDDVYKDPIISLMINLSVTIIVIILTDSKKMYNVLQKLIKFGEKSKSQEAILAIIFAMGIFGRKNIDYINFKESYFVNIILVIIFTIVVYFLLKEKENSIALSQKHDQLLNYIQKYEEELTKKNMTIHEFKNQIITIKSFVSKRNRELNSYINSIICELKDLQNNLLSDMEYIPKGGLKGLIYFKLGDLKEKGISVITNIDSKMKKTAFGSSDSALYRDVLKVIGVYLDNAIDAVTEAKNKQIIMEIYCKNKESHFVLSNTYTNHINLDDLGKKRYSTKGKNRGYGIQLVDKLIHEHKNLTQNVEVDEAYYTVHLIVK